MRKIGWKQVIYVVEGGRQNMDRHSDPVGDSRPLITNYREVGKFSYDLVYKSIYERCW